MTTPTQILSDRAVSYLRTAVPIAWGSLVSVLLGWLAPHLPGELGPLLVEALGGEATVTLVVGLAIAGWYAVWRLLESRIPDWLTRIVLGSSAAPVYSPAVVVDVAASAGYEVGEVFDAKTEVVGLIGELEGEDCLEIGDQIVSRLIESGWRPTISAGRHRT